MLIDLNKQGLACLIKGTYPSYENMNDPLVKDKGHYVGGFYDRWEWNFNPDHYTEEELYKTWCLVIQPQPIFKTKEPSFKDDPVYRELQNIIEDGKKLKNYSMIKAAEDELKRLGWVEDETRTMG